MIRNYFEAEALHKRMLIKNFGYYPDMEIKRKQIMLHQRYFAQKRLLFGRMKSQETLKSIMKEDVGCHIKNVKLDKHFIKFIKNINKLDLKGICIKNNLQKLTGIKKSTYNSQEITKFLIFFINKYIPYKLFETRKYFKKFRRNCINMVLAHYKQSVFLSDIMQSLNKTTREKRYIRSKISLWLYKLILKLVSHLFYVTEGAKCRELIFYNYKYWNELQNKSIESLVNSGEIIEIKTLPKDTSLGRMRLVPKSAINSLRPLVIKSMDQKSQTTLIRRCNILLKQLLASKKNTYPNINSDLHIAWSNFCNKTMGYKEKIYFVKMDIQNAYGSIIYEVLKNILKDMFDRYIKTTTLSIQKCTYRGIWKMNQTEQFHGLTPLRTKNVIQIIDKTEIVPVDEMKQFILHFIDNIKVLMSYTNKSYKYIKGVPQGSPLSPVLCEIYYSHLDEKYFNIFSKEEGDVFYRAVDDYLFISKSKEKATRFFSIMENGIQEYGVSTNVEKTSTNLCNDINCVPYFGFLFNLKTKQIKPYLDNSKYVKPLSTISIKKPMCLKSLSERMLYTHTLKLYILLFDSRYQWKRTILENAFDAASVMALRYDCLVNELVYLQKVKYVSQLVYIIMGSIFKISRGSQKKSNSDRVPPFSVNCFICTVLKAFIKVMKKKSFHLNVVKVLQKRYRIYFSTLQNREKKIVKLVGKSTTEPV